jgi:hypothetical protein
LDNHDKDNVGEDNDENDDDGKKDDMPREINVFLSSLGSLAFSKGGSCNSLLSLSMPEEEQQSHPISLPSLTTYHNHHHDRSLDGGGGRGSHPISMPLLLSMLYRNCSQDSSLNYSHGGMRGAIGGRSPF